MYSEIYFFHSYCWSCFNLLVCVGVSTGCVVWGVRTQRTPLSEAYASRWYIFVYVYLFVPTVTLRIEALGHISVSLPSHRGAGSHPVTSLYCNLANTLLLWKSVWHRACVTLSNRFFENSNLNLKFCVALCNAVWKSYAKNEENLYFHFLCVIIFSNSTFNFKFCVGLCN